ncbi:Olfactory receptor 10A7 [Cricetulus griseus]|uniref:Olfactory receptor n=1 Tax=Cricetulus griseus TaxID=10029 RepID=G3IN95_CRIGR|nr:Olfactory receptor 10A7 [Cricetulus griseus]
MLAVLFLAAFLLTLLGNTLIVLLTSLDPGLRAPMYLFLRQLALVEICFSLDVAPRLLVTLLWPGRGMYPTSCALQLLLVLSCVTTECLLLTVMAWDRFLAICRPLHYGTIMSLRLCHLLATTCWLAGIPLSLVFTIWLFNFPYCGSRGIRHYLCDISPLLSLVCADTRVFEANAISFWAPQGPVYLCYLRPKSSYSPESKQVVSLSYTMVTPMFNPLIYSLRNKEFKAALVRVFIQRRGTFTL